MSIRGECFAALLKITGLICKAEDREAGKLEEEQHCGDQRGRKGNLATRISPIMYPTRCGQSDPGVVLRVCGQAEEAKVPTLPEQWLADPGWRPVHGHTFQAGCEWLEGPPPPTPYPLYSGEKLIK